MAKKVPNQKSSDYIGIGKLQNTSTNKKIAAGTKQSKPAMKEAINSADKLLTNKKIAADKLLANKNKKK